MLVSCSFSSPSFFSDREVMTVLICASMVGSNSRDDSGARSSSSSRLSSIHGQAAFA